MTQNKNPLQFEATQATRKSRASSHKYLFRKQDEVFFHNNCSRGASRHAE